MRIATWNMDSGWSARHRAFLGDLKADVLLLTEVAPELEVHARSTGTMTPGQSFAAVVGAEPESCGAASTARGSRDGVTFLSTVLPWRSYGGSQADNTRSWLAALDEEWPHGEVVWGGDWNHELHGRMWVGSREGREEILALLEKRGLTCPTAKLQTRKGDRSINHIAVPAHWSTSAPEVVEATGLSDHDAIVLERL